MTKPTELRTERLLLRPFRLSDIDDVLEYASDPEWATYYPRPYDRGRAEYVVAQAVLTSRDKGAVFAVEHDGRVIGLISLTVDPEDKTAELGLRHRQRHVGAEEWRRRLRRPSAIGDFGSTDSPRSTRWRGRAEHAIPDA